MVTGACPYCYSVIDERAEICPYCQGGLNPGSENKAMNIVVDIFAFLVVIGIIVLIIYFWRLGNS